MPAIHAPFAVFAHHRPAKTMAAFVTLGVALALFLVGIGIGTARADGKAHHVAAARSYVAAPAVQCTDVVRGTTAAKSSARGRSQGMCPGGRS
ncbi:hypothetical protein [Streptomyces sp. NPDC002265]|uniref:hypothetical protein n=1 Tax=Streptomyces sp. NPDC002265 TaxID=3154415 RepID=UPI0033295AF1